MKVVLSEQQANQLLSYLGSKPFVEVQGLIMMIQGSIERPAPVEVKKAEEKKA